MTRDGFNLLVTFSDTMSCCRRMSGYTRRLMSPTIGISRMLTVVALYLVILDNIRFSSGFGLAPWILYYGFVCLTRSHSTTIGFCRHLTKDSVVFDLWATYSAWWCSTYVSLRRCVLMFLTVSACLAQHDLYDLVCKELIHWMNTCKCCKLKSMQWWICSFWALRDAGRRWLDICLPFGGGSGAQDQQLCISDGVPTSTTRMFSIYVMTMMLSMFSF